MAHFENCQRCEGTGTVSCPACSGAGRATPRYPSQANYSDYMGKCDRCKGERKISCPDCKGSGTVKLPD